MFTGLYSVDRHPGGAARGARSPGAAPRSTWRCSTRSSRVLANQAMNYFVSGRSPRRMGNAHPNLVPYQVFEAADGPLIVATGNDRQARDFCRIVGPRRPRRRSALRHQRRPHRAAAPNTSPRSPSATRKMRRADLLAALEAANVPAGPINTVAEAFADPQAIARGMRMELPATGVRGGTAPAVRSPMVMDGEGLVADRAAPRLGEHTEAVLAGLGYDEGARRG